VFTPFFRIPSPLFYHQNSKKAIVPLAIIFALHKYHWATKNILAFFSAKIISILSIFSTKMKVCALNRQKSRPDNRDGFAFEYFV
jgi:hypothetical protein